MATATLKEKLGAMSPDEAVEYINALIYGPPGSGKTHLFGTAGLHPDLHPALLLDVEGGMMTLRGVKGVDVLPVRSVDELLQKHEELRKDDSGYYKVVGIDTLNELQDIDMKFVLNQRNQKRPDLKDDPPSMREWGLCRDHMRRIVRAFRDLPMHTIFLAHSDTSKDEEITSYAPMLPGKLQKELPGFVDIVGYLSSDSRQQGKEVFIERKLQFANTKRVMAKDRSRALGDVLENPTLPLMWELIQKGETSA
jgi:hypothetical protein